MSNFEKTKKYYTNAEVEKKMKTVLGAQELKIAVQNDEILCLRAKNEKQEKSIRELERREKIIRNALTKATDIAREEWQKAKQMKLQELEKLNLVYEKLVALGAKTPIINSVIADLKNVIDIMKNSAGSIEQARHEELKKAQIKLHEANKNTRDAQKSIDERYKAVLEKYESIKTKTKEGFKIEEALNPTESLEEIMKEIFNK